MRRVCGSLLVLVLTTVFAVADEGHQHELTAEEVGSVSFTTSCGKGVQEEFNRAVALLHSFQYEQAGQAFSKIAAKDPTCAMAHWGVAMSYYHGLWENSDFEKGRVAAAKAKEVASKNPQTTAREKAYIEAIGEIYNQDQADKDARAKAFESKMAALQAAYPDDTEAAIFHALSLAITAPKTDRTYANQRKCGEILEPIFQKQPHHPGVAHYLIHCYDNPVLAEKALPASRAYAKIAPASAHAHHMPSHIFTRVGSWDESIESNNSSAAIAAKAEQESKTGEARDQRLHAMDYLEYAYLQSGRVNDAKRVIDEMNSLPPIPGLSLAGNYATAAIPARFAVELGNWKEAASLQADKSAVPWAQGITWMAVGIGSARSGNTSRAKQAEQSLMWIRDGLSSKNEYWSKQVEVQRREVAAWIAEQSGRHEEALKTMRDAAELEESMEKSPMTPGAVTPAREMLAELLRKDQPKLALVEYEAVLKTSPNRFNALYGAAMAADAAGDAATASKYFRKLTETAVGEERPELATARQKLTVAMK